MDGKQIVFMLKPLARSDSCSVTLVQCSRNRPQRDTAACTTLFNATFIAFHGLFHPDDMSPLLFSSAPVLPAWRPQPSPRVGRNVSQRTAVLTTSTTSMRPPHGSAPRFQEARSLNFKSRQLRLILLAVVRISPSSVRRSSSVVSWRCLPWRYRITPHSALVGVWERPGLY